MISLLTTVVSYQGISVAQSFRFPQKLLGWLTKTSSFFWTAVFLVTVPVFIQAPLVRALPWLSLGLTPVWFVLGWFLWRSPRHHRWGDLCLGFSWSWLAGSIYWGWFRWEPLWHLPIEAIALPIAFWGLRQHWGIIGHCFYLGSLIGTALTDSYFVLTGLMTHWRQVMIVDPDFADLVLKSALARVHTPWGVSLGAVFLGILLLLGAWGWRQRRDHWQAFAGAVISTIIVDSLFWMAAIMA